jgi:hypothetical protein
MFFLCSFLVAMQKHYFEVLLSWYFVLGTLYQLLQILQLPKVIILQILVHSCNGGFDFF